LYYNYSISFCSLYIIVHYFLPRWKVKVYLGS